MSLILQRKRNIEKLIESGYAYCHYEEKYVKIKYFDKYPPSKYNKSENPTGTPIFQAVCRQCKSLNRDLSFKYEKRGYHPLQQFKPTINEKTSMVR